MKKMFISVVFLLMCGTVFAQYAAPENLGVSFPDYHETGVSQIIYLYWDVVEDPDFDHYEYFHDGEPYEDPYGYGIYGCLEMEIPQDNEYHTSGIIAVYTDGGISDTVSITYYYSHTAYSRPTNIVIENDLNAMSADVQFDEPVSGGAGAPTPELYSFYVDGTYMLSSSGTAVTLELEPAAVEQGESYVLGIEVMYSDGHSSDDFRPRVLKESYFGELSPAQDVTVDDQTGVLSWSVPGDGDVIGGTISNLVGALMGWNGIVWPTLDGWQFGDGTHYVNTSWYAGGWVHDYGYVEYEFVYVGCLGADYNIEDTYVSGIDVTSVNQITDTSTLEFEDDDVELSDADTSLDGYGDFMVLKNIETGYYGVVQVIDVTCSVFPDVVDNIFEYFDITWWFQTNGSDDFSSAERYYPLYYNIYLDGTLVDSVKYELVTVDKETYELIVVDSTLSPNGEFEYQFEGLVNGETYTAEVEAVYYASVGKAERQSFEFTYNGISVDDPQTGASSPILSNYPNPFNQCTNISFSITKPGHVTLDVYNIKGEKVKTLVDETLEATDHVIPWNGTDDNGKFVSNGVYLYRMSVEDKNVISNKMILMR